MCHTKSQVKGPTVLFRKVLLLVRRFPVQGRYRSSVVAENEDWLGRVAGIRTWSRGGKRAPHKPLLLLYALGRLQQTGRNEPVLYAEAEAPLARLLADFGPPRATTPAYPFKRLDRDGLWRLTTEGDQPTEDQPGSLKRAKARGDLDTDFCRCAPCGPSALGSGSPSAPGLPVP